MRVFSLSVCRTCVSWSMGKEVELFGLRAKKMERTPRLRYSFGLTSAGGHLFSEIYIYKRLRPSKKIRNRKKKEQQKLWTWPPNLLNLNAGWLTGGGGGGLVDPCKVWVPPPSIIYKLKVLLEVVQRKLLNGITLGQRQSDSNNWLIIISKLALTYIRYKIVIWDLSTWINLISLTDW